MTQLGDLTVEITADDSRFRALLSEIVDVLERDQRMGARRCAGGYLSPFFIPAPRIDRCPVCREPIDLDKVNAVGPKGTAHEGKIIHRICEIKALQDRRNQELAEGRGEVYIPF